MKEASDKSSQRRLPPASEGRRQPKAFGAVKPEASSHPAFDPLFKAREAAAYLEMSPDVLVRKAREGEIASVREAGSAAQQLTHWKFRLSALNRWIAERESQARRVI